MLGNYKFLYISPERIATQLFRSRSVRLNVSLVAIDEAHCISQWGYDFRPSYLEISSLREILEGVPVLALTATATPEVCDDIQERLSFREKNLLRKSFDRENLTYLVRHTEDKTRELTGIVQKLKGSGIIYARNRRKCREIAQHLRSPGGSAAIQTVILANWLIIALLSMMAKSASDSDRVHCMVSRSFKYQVVIM